jgi:RNA polymerase sigma-70 factor (sigma-E family)
VEVIQIEAASPTCGDWEGLVTAVSPALLRLALMLTGNRPEAEDLFQVTFARACRHGDRIAQMDAPAGYLRKVMLNEHVSRRRIRRVLTLSLEEVVEPAAPEVAGIDERDAAWRWLATLPRQQRAVLVLRFYEDLSDDEIADLVGCSRATVRSHASHGLAALRVLLTSHVEEK